MGAQAAHPCFTEAAAAILDENWAPNGFDLLASVFAVIAPQESANNGPDLLGRWGAGTEIGTALFGTELEQFNTVCIKRTSQLRYR